MVYYTTGLPLLMQQAESNGSSQVCFPNDQVPQQQQQIAYQQQQQQQQQQHQVVNLSNSVASSSAQLNGYSGTSFQQPPSQSTVAATGKFRCDICNINFGSKSAQTSHMKSHTKQQQQQIDSKVAAMKGANSAGTGQQMPADPYQCDVCKKTFAVPARLVRHYRTHTGERPFECEFCHKMFSVKENLQVHRRIHTKERPYKCDICGRAFEHSGKLHRHMRIHTGERPHKCTVCGKTFIQSGQLVIHMRTHTGEKPYKCPVEGCGKGFTCSKQLKVHSRTHTGEKPYHCDICFRDFGYNHVLKLHRVQHYGAKCYKCTICDETFKSKKEMEAHIKGHADELPDDDETDSKLSVAASTSSSTSSSSSSRSNSLEYASSSASTPPSTESVLTEEPMVLEEDIPPPRIEFREHSEGVNPPEGVHYYSQFEKSVLRQYGVQSGVNPALLAAASIAAAASASGLDSKDLPTMCNNASPSPPPLIYQNSTIQHQQEYMSTGTGRLTPSSSSGSIQSEPMDMHREVKHSHLLHQQQHQQLQQLDQQQHHQQSPPPALNGGTFMYEPFPIMKHHGYFAPASQSSDFRSSSDIVRQVEAALSGTENLLTPPRSSPESPDRSSSPESDSAILMSDRDNNTLPPRKRKLYFKDQHQQVQQQQQHHLEPEQSDVTDLSPDHRRNSASSPPVPAVRMSSVIQFARAS
ncbi:Krueppel homolog 1 isoform X2 [Uranotaenia lowii]|nr:Krueppel homolog 1 isoform X2 [Uranotaenia lowii]